MRKQQGDTPEFNAFYDEYPNPQAKGAARKAWAKAIKIATPLEIMSGLRRYPFRADPQFQAHPATWLNTESWIVGTPKAPPTVIVSKPESELAAFERALGIGADDVAIVVIEPQTRLL